MVRLERGFVTGLSCAATACARARGCCACTHGLTPLAVYIYILLIGRGTPVRRACAGYARTRVLDVRSMVVPIALGETQIYVPVYRTQLNTIMTDVLHYMYGFIL